MNILQKMLWLKSDWKMPPMSQDVKDLLRHCAVLPEMEVDYKIDDIISRSNAFPIPFPIQNNRLEKLRCHRPVERLNRNIQSTYPIVHERVLIQIARFLVYKRQSGSSIEKALYKDMTIPEFIDRLLKKRAVTFMRSGDFYKLITGTTGIRGWESVGTSDECPPLILEECLSYDEIKLSAMLYVSGYTECINNGAINNKGVLSEENFEDNAVIIGVVEPRYTKKFRMEYEDSIISKEQNVTERGYGTDISDSIKKIWSDFYEFPNYNYSEFTSEDLLSNDSYFLRYQQRFAKLRNNIIFNNEVYYKRISVTIDCCLLEANSRAKAEGNMAFLNVIGAGLGVSWKASSHQNDVYGLTVLDRVRVLMTSGHLNHVSDVNLAYIDVSEAVLVLFKTEEHATKPRKLFKLFVEHEEHPNGGINFQIEHREPSEKLSLEHEGKLLVITYACDGNAHPGNEYWWCETAALQSSSGDPAAACSTQIAELHNAHINPTLSANNTRVIGTLGLHTLQDYCTNLRWFFFFQNLQ